METIINTVMSILLGMLPEVLYFTLFLIYTKNIKEKKLKLFILIALAYILCIMISRHKILYYVSFIFIIYIILKILYKQKAQIIDIFVISIAFMYVCIISCICSLFINNSYILYYILLIVDKVLLFLPFMFKNNFNLLYKKYYGLWNRNDNVKRPIKSITLRNISLVALNTFIFLCNVVCLYIFSLK